MNQSNTFILSVGHYLPPTVVTNDDLADRLDTNDEWIVRRTGIKTRRFASPDQVTSDLAHLASINALHKAGMDPSEIDLVLVATLSPDQPLPATACFLQEKLGIPGIPAFDITAACTGFLYALSVARQFVATGSANNVLVVGAEIASRVIDPQDRGTAILFGDGAGAAIVSNKKGPLAIREIRLGADGRAANLIRTEVGGTKMPFSETALQRRNHFMMLEGREVFREGVEKFANQVSEIMDAHQIQADDIAQVILHQSNARMMEAAIERVALPADKFFNNVDRYGNTCAASIPICLSEFLEESPNSLGHVICAAVGAGLTWGSTLLTKA